MKEEIKQKIEMTKETIKDEMDSFIIDSSTGMFNEIFLREYLKNIISLNDIQKIKKNIILMAVNVDNITKINSQYSNATGDETITNLGYLIKQIVSDDELIFKRKGPGYYVLIQEFEGRTIKDYADFIQNQVKKSEAFIEQITVSISVVKLNELDKTLNVEEKIDKLISLCNSRINMSHRLHDNAFIDSDNLDVELSFGAVLVVESDPLTLDILKMFLEKNNYNVTACKDGVSAVNYAKGKKFDAIIVDRYTHKIDGLMIKRHLNESSINMTTLFLLTVRSKNVNIVEKANHLNIDFVIEKPIIFEEIQGIIHREVSRKAFIVI